MSTFGKLFEGKKYLFLNKFVKETPRFSCITTHIVIHTNYIVAQQIKKSCFYKLEGIFWPLTVLLEKTSNKWSKNISLEEKQVFSHTPKKKLIIFGKVIHSCCKLSLLTPLCSFLPIFTKSRGLLCFTHLFYLLRPEYMSASFLFLFLSLPQVCQYFCLIL